MTFAAVAAWQAWLLLAGAAALAAGLFLIKVRPPRMLVPSLLLWRRVLDESRDLTLWERIRRAVSLALTVLIALTLALAAVRPARVGGATDVAEGRLLIVIDSSWSMAARTRTGETRWERGIAEARRLVLGRAGGEVALATTADGLVEGPTTDAALIETALDRITPGAGEAAAWPKLAGAPAVHFITDGATTRAPDPNVVVHSVFETAPNVAITAFELRPSLAIEYAGDAYLEIANFAPAQNMRVRILRGPASLFDRTFDVASSEVLRQVVPIPRGGDRSLRARVDAPNNALAADDEAVAWVDRARPLSVMVVGAHTEWLRTAFERDPDVRAVFLQQADYRPASSPQDAPDVLIFDGWAPAEPPRRPAILFAPPASTSWLAASASDPSSAGVPGRVREERHPRWDIPGTHRVVRGVDPFTLSIDRARAYTATSLVPVAQSSRGTPLVSVSESADARLVVVAFGATESNLASAPGFPVLLGNSLDWLARPEVLSTRARPAPSAGSGQAPRKPGLVAFDGAIGKVTGPQGAPVPLTMVNGTAMAVLRAPGLYIAESGGARSRFPINIGDPQLSNLTRTSEAGAARTRTVSAGASASPWWVYCAAVAFVLAMVEWWTWQRRITI